MHIGLPVQGAITASLLSLAYANSADHQAIGERLRTFFANYDTESTDTNDFKDEMEACFKKVRNFNAVRNGMLEMEDRHYLDNDESMRPYIKWFRDLVLHLESKGTNAAKNADTIDVWDIAVEYGMNGNFDLDIIDKWDIAGYLGTGATKHLNFDYDVWSVLMFTKDLLQQTDPARLSTVIAGEGGEVGGLWAFARVVTRAWGAQSHYLSTPQMDDPGFNPLMAVFLVQARLGYLAALGYEGDADGNISAHMEAYRRWVHKSFAVAAIPLNGIRPDGTYSTYPKHSSFTFAETVLFYGALAVHILDGTSWELNNDTRRNLAHAIYNRALFTPNGNMPFELWQYSFSQKYSERFKDHVWCGLVLLGGDPAVKTEMRQNMLGLAYAATNPSKWKSMTDNRGGPGCLRVWEKQGLRQIGQSIVEASGGYGGDFLGGLAVYPFSGAALLRSRGWMVIARCYSREIPTAYVQQGGKAFPGYYIGAGSVLLLSSTGGFIESGDMLHNGFHWYQYPGITVVQGDPSEAISTDTRKRAADAGLAQDDFCGGVQADLKSNQSSALAWGFQFEDLLAEENPLRVKKSVFMLLKHASGSESSRAIVINIGSGISGAGPAEMVDTTLFQNELNQNEDATLVLGETTQISHGQVWYGPSTKGDIIRLLDVVGNGYVVVGAESQSLLVKRTTQSSKKITGTGNKNGKWVTARIRHRDPNGETTPSESYEYITFPGATQQEVEEFIPSEWYNVLIRGPNVHMIHLHFINVFAFVAYTGTVLPDEVRHTVVVRNVSRPCAAVWIHGEDHLNLTVSVPRFGWLEDGTVAGDFGVYDYGRKQSQAQEITLVLTGEWELNPDQSYVVQGLGFNGSAASVVSNVTRNDHMTNVVLLVKHGESLQLTLYKGAADPATKSCTDLLHDTLISLEEEGLQIERC